MLATISAYQVSAQHYFERLQALQIDLLLDIRLKNTSQLCGFTKKQDLEYLMSALCRAAYVHDPLFAPDAARHFQERHGAFRTVCLLGTATEKRRSHAKALQRYLEGKELDDVRT